MASVLLLVHFMVVRVVEEDYEEVEGYVAERRGVRGGE